MNRNILIIGGKGKTGRLISDKLSQRDCSHKVGTRHPSTSNEVRFDWMNPDTANQAFDNVATLYIVAPTNSSDHQLIVPPILETALKKNVSRFVLLSASSIEPGGPMMGQIHQWLINNAPEWAVLRPTWFMQNFLEQRHLSTIQKEGVIYSATGKGKAGFIDADDIANVAVEALLSETSWNQDYILTGPESLSYADVACTIQRFTGKEIKHVNLSVEQLTKRYEENGLPSEYATILASMDSTIEQGTEDRITENIYNLTGHQPGSFEHFLQREWQKKQTLQGVS